MLLVHGNQAIQPASVTQALVRSGTPAVGYSRLLQTHEAYNAPLTLHLTWGGMEAVVVTPSMLPDHIRITMADNFHPIQDAVEVPLEPVREDILIHIHHSV